MRRALAATLTTAILGAIFVVAGTPTPAAAADPAPVSCGGILAIPSDAILASDRNGSPILITSTGAVIRCDGSGASSDLSMSALGFVGDPPATAAAEATESTFVAPISGRSWTLADETIVPDSLPTALGYLGSNADMSVIFWRSTVGGPIEMWVSEAAITP